MLWLEPPIQPSSSVSRSMMGVFDLVMTALDSCAWVDEGCAMASELIRARSGMRRLIPCG